MTRIPVTSSRLAAAVALLAVAFAGHAAHAETTPPQPASAQPSLPQPIPGGGNDNFLKTMGGPDTGLEPLKPSGSRPGHRGDHKGSTRHHARLHRSRTVARVERPALAGVELAAPLPRPPQPPHFTTPTPAYPLENFVAAFTTPLPPVVCHPAPRDPDLPDPRLFRERGLACASDNP